MRGSKKDTQWKHFYNLSLTPDEVARRDASKGLIKETIAILRIDLPRALKASTASRYPPRGNRDVAPLSRQAPIAVLTTPEPPSHHFPETPSRKRYRVTEDDSSDDEIRVASVRKHVHRERVELSQASFHTV